MSDGEAMAVRGGKSRDPGPLLEKIFDAVEDGYGAVLSIFCESPDPGESREQLLKRICQEVDIPHTMVQVSTVSRLSAAGFEVVAERAPDEHRFHHHVYFVEPVAESRVAEFVECFAAPVPNPTGGKKRKP